jgi:hypothetical protein
MGGEASYYSLSNNQYPEIIKAQSNLYTNNQGLLLPLWREVGGEVFGLSIDPLSEKFPSESHYISMANDPINRIDPDGKWSVAPDLARKLEVAMAVATDYWIADEADGIENATQKTVLDVIGTMVITPLKIGENTTDAIHRVSNAEDGYDYAIAACEVLADLGAIASLVQVKPIGVKGIPDELFIVSSEAPEIIAKKGFDPATYNQSHVENDFYSVMGNGTDPVIQAYGKLLEAKSMSGNYVYKIKKNFDIIDVRGLAAAQDIRLYYPEQSQFVTFQKVMPADVLGYYQMIPHGRSSYYWTWMGKMPPVPPVK